jgi:Uma2 family endonuclease
MTNSALAKKNTDGGCFTYGDYKSWELKPGERFELIYGEAYAMAAPSYYHQMILMELAGQIRDYLKGKPCKVVPAPFDVRLFYEEDESDDTVVQPDVVVVCDRKKRGPEGCRGAPDLAVEILSPANTASEMERKFELYRAAGVREYWVLDPQEKALYAYRFEDGSTGDGAIEGDTIEDIHARVYRAPGSAPVGIFPGLEIDLESVFEEDLPLP